MMLDKMPKPTCMATTREIDTVDDPVSLPVRSSYQENVIPSGPHQQSWADIVENRGILPRPLVLESSCIRS
ncbi:hypothetical protein U1Q18_017860, partial [Sarracenia purpurea var. burkii]